MNPNPALIEGINLHFSSAKRLKRTDSLNLTGPEAPAFDRDAVSDATLRVEHGHSARAKGASRSAVFRQVAKIICGRRLTCSAGYDVYRPHMHYEPMNFSDLAESELGKRLWARLNEEKSVWAMEVATKLRRPAVEPLGDDLLAEFGNTVRRRRIKQMIGHMARQIMEAYGYELAAQRIPIRFSKLFSTASRYKPAQRRKERHV